MRRRPGARPIRTVEAEATGPAVVATAGVKTARVEEVTATEAEVRVVLGAEELPVGAGVRREVGTSSRSRCRIRTRSPAGRGCR